MAYIIIHSDFQAPQRIGIKAHRQSRVESNTELSIRVLRRIRVHGLFIYCL